MVSCRRFPTIRRSCRVLPRAAFLYYNLNRICRRPTKKYAFIDALRGYAILGVLMVHSAQSVAPRHGFLHTAMAGGGRGVQLFYIASPRHYMYR
jgi:hypothetical protein